MCIRDRTLTHTMWPALGAAAIVFLLAHNASRLGSRRNRLVALLLVVLIAGISAAQFFVASTIKRSEQSASQGVVTAVMRDERILIWKYALHRAADRPLYGYGYGRGIPVSYTHLRAHETVLDLVCRLLLEKKKTRH